MKKTALLSLLLIFSFCLFGQNKQETDIDQWLYQTEEENIDASRDTVITNDLIKVNYNHSYPCQRRKTCPAAQQAKEESLWQNIKAVNRAAPTAPSSRT